MGLHAPDPKRLEKGATSQGVIESGRIQKTIAPDVPPVGYGISLRRYDSLVGFAVGVLFGLACCVG
jgi:hypothetical protein